MAMYGVPESAQASVERQVLNQYYKCIECSLEGLDEHINFLYQVNGTILCLRHARAERTKHAKIDTFNQPGTFNV